MLTQTQLSLFKFIQGNKPFFFKNVFKNIFSWKELNKILNNTPLMNYNRFNVVGGEKTPSKDLSGWQLDKTVLGPSQISKHIKSNVCFLEDCSRVNYEINEIAKNIEDFSQQSCDAHIFFSLKEEQKDTDGFGMHADFSSNLIIQVEGSTHFTVEDHFEIILNPSDCVYVPAGVRHKAVSLEKRLSISFPFASDPRPKQDRFWIDF